MVGLGFRPELAADLVAAPRTVDFVEVVAETCYTQRATRRETGAVAEIWPVIPHGVKLSLGSAGGIDVDRVRRLAALARELRASVVSEHVSFTRAVGVDIGHLTQLPRTREAVRVVARNVARARRELDVPLLLENVAWSVQWPGAEMDEASFYHEVVAATGCELLLDAGNLYANAVNEGRDPREVLLGYPLDRVGMVHVAGGVWEDGFYFDTHAHPVPPAVIELVAAIVARQPDVPVMIERDADFDFAALARELAVLRALPRGTAACAATAPSPGVERARDLAAEQAALASALVGTGPAPGFDAGELERARGILQRKRIDDAMPLVPNLGRANIRDVAAAALAGTRRRGAPGDAWRIAVAALAEPTLAPAAALDQLLLRARFTGLDDVVRPRRAPFVGFARLPDGRRLRATKGLGALAEVTLHEGR
jgi:uncharacterized protein (UPF0276 family)